MSDTVPNLPADNQPPAPGPEDTQAHPAPQTTPNLRVVPDDAPATGPVAQPFAPKSPVAEPPAGETLMNMPVARRAEPPPPPPAAPPPPPPSSSGPSANPDPGGLSLPMVVGVFALALVGIVLLALGIYAVARLGSPAQTAATHTATAIVIDTQVAVIPTTTPQPTNTDTPEPTVTPTEAAPTATHTPSSAGTDATTPAAGETLTPPVDTSVVTIVTGANVREGPGTNYPVIGNIAEGGTAPILGISAAGTWYAVDFGGALEGRAWISKQVARYDGDESDLAVVAAPPPPAATATPKPANNPAPGPIAGSHGVSGQLRICGGKLTYAVNERVCFIEWIKNTTAAPISYGVLGVGAVKSGGGSQFQTSWSAQLAPQGLLWIDPGCVGPTDRCNGEWEDGIRLSSAGSWTLSLQVCFSDFDTCLNGGAWETLSQPITVQVN